MTGVETTPGPAFPALSSRAAAFATLASIAVSLAGIGGQLSNAHSVLFPLIGGFGLSILATIVLVHQRR